MKKNKYILITSFFSIAFCLIVSLFTMDKVKASQYNYSTEDNYIGDNTSIKDDISKMNLDYEDFTFSLDNYKYMVL